MPVRLREVTALKYLVTANNCMARLDHTIALTRDWKAPIVNCNTVQLWWFHRSWTCLKTETRKIKHSCSTWGLHTNTARASYGDHSSTSPNTEQKLNDRKRNRELGLPTLVQKLVQTIDERHSRALQFAEWMLRAAGRTRRGPGLTRLTLDERGEAISSLDEKVEGLSWVWRSRASWRGTARNRIRQATRYLNFASGEIRTTKAKPNLCRAVVATPGRPRILSSFSFVTAEPICVNQGQNLKLASCRSSLEVVFGTDRHYYSRVSSLSHFNGHLKSEQTRYEGWDDPIESSIDETKG